jgi:signal transduction histidine kinase
MKVRDLYQRGTGRAVVVGGLVLFVLAVYVLVVLGGGVLLGRTDSPSAALSVLATTVVALAFAPVQSRLERISLRLATPYDVLTRFAGGVDAGEGDAAEDVPARMSRLLAQGTGAQWAQVWLQGSGQLSLAGRWPAEQARTVVGADDPLSLPVRYGDQVLAELRLQERPGVPLTAVEERLFVGLAGQAGLVLRLVGLRAQLEVRHRELQERTRELEGSRGRVIEAQDAERSRRERGIHDGAQQHLVTRAVNLRLAQVVARRSPDRATQVLAEQADAARLAIVTLSSLSRGIYPQMLADDGLVAALRSGLAASSVAVTVEASGSGRPPPVLEAALYFCCMEAVQNAAKHSGATRVTVGLGQEEGRWRLDVTDDGSGFDAPDAFAAGTGAGLMNMCDRLDAVGGSVTVTSRAGAGTIVTAVGPARDRDV